MFLCDTKAILDGGHSHRHCVQSCNWGQDAVKQSRHFLVLGVGQRSSGVLRYYHNTIIVLVTKRHGWSFVHAQLIKGQEQKFGVVKQSRPFFQWSNI